MLIEFYCKREVLLEVTARLIRLGNAYAGFALIKHRIACFY